MAWETLYQPNKNESAAIFSEYSKKAKFLIDENLAGITTETFNRLGWDAKDIHDYGLSGHDDHDVFSTAWREKRILITKDRDFLDNKQFPEHRNPGIIIVPNTEYGSDLFIKYLTIIFNIIGPLSKLYQKSKIIITPTGELSIINRDKFSGKIIKERYRFLENGDTQIWKD